MQKLIYFIPCALFLACGDPATTETEVKEERIDLVLNENDLFASNKIMAFLENTTKFIDEANSYFLKGVDSYRNKKNLDSAQYYFRQSLLKEPSAKAYFELGNVYYDRKQWDKVEMAYGMAEKLDYQPFSKILYNKACMYSLRGDDELSGQYLEYALQAGYINMDHINKDADLANLRETYNFKRAIEKGLRGMSDAENLYWLQFKKQFTKVEVPTKLKNVMSRKELDQLQFISYDYEKYVSEMRDEQFSREVSKGFYYFGQSYETKEYVALVYIVKDEFLGDDAPLLYRIATFTHEGRLIDKQVIGGRELFESDIFEATMKKGGVIDVVVKRPIYEKDPVEEGYWDNPIKEMKQIGTRKFTIRNNGIIVEESNQVAMN